jgi:hypothetical protein
MSSSNGNNHGQQPEIDPMMGLRIIIADLNKENALLRQLVTDYALYVQIDRQNDPKGERWIKLARRSWELARKVDL